MNDLGLENEVKLLAQIGGGPLLRGEKRKRLWPLGFGSQEGGRERTSDQRTRWCRPSEQWMFLRRSGNSSEEWEKEESPNTEYYQGGKEYHIKGLGVQGSPTENSGTAPTEAEGIGSKRSGQGSCESGIWTLDWRGFRGQKVG